MSEPKVETEKPTLRVDYSPVAGFLVSEVTPASAVPASSAVREKVPHKQADTQAPAWGGGPTGMGGC